MDISGGRNRGRDFASEWRVAVPPASVWAVLIDLPRYGEWNSFLPHAGGDTRAGGRVLLQMRPPGGNPMRFTAHVEQADAPQRLRWVGRLLTDALFRAAYEFELEPAGNRATRLRISARFSGALVNLVPASLYRRQHRGLERMAEALQKRAVAGR